MTLNKVNFEKRCILYENMKFPEENGTDEFIYTSGLIPRCRLHELAGSKQRYFKKCHQKYEN